MAKKVWNGILTAVIVLCVVSAGFMGWRVFETRRDYQKGEEALNQVYRMMQQIQETAAESGEKEASEGEADQKTAREHMLEVYEALHLENEDLIGWIQIPGTQIDYPVMYTPQDPTYYQYRSFQKEKNSYGTIFIDGDCRMEDAPPNVILYGHHMRNGAMFAELQNYDSFEFWQEHQTVYFDTLEENGDWQVVAAFKRPAEELDEEFKKMLLAETAEDYERLADYIRRYQFYDTGIEFSWPEELITLTTCEYTQGDGRLLVIARRVE